MVDVEGGAPGDNGARDDAIRLRLGDVRLSAINAEYAAEARRLRHPMARFVAAIRRGFRRG